LASGSLLDLQRIEQEIVGLEGQIVAARRVIEGDPSSTDPRPRLLVAEVRRKEVGRRLDAAEAQEREERARARSHERQLYSGAIHNPRELTQLAEELDHLRVRLKDEEDDELALMVELEQAEEEVRQATAEAAGAKEVLQAKRAALTDAQRRRELQAASIDPEQLKLYERVKAFRQSPYVVPINNGACGGCRIPLSMAQLRTIKLHPEPTVCQTCGRILVA
jgi:predicted  nucleic acid-binding Zn-ribbon protein